MQVSEFILDSGAFTEYRKGKVIDIEKYAEFVKEHGNLFKFAFNLDVIGDARKSFQNWRWLRKNGVDTVPIYHQGTDVKYLKKYLDDCGFIGLGAIANMHSVARVKALEHLWRSYLLNDKEEAVVKVHGLGLTATDILERYPWYSTDSISPVVCGIWGGCMFPAIRAEGVDFSSIKALQITSRRTHTTNTAGSYHTLPITHKRIYEELFKERGFHISSLAKPIRELPLFGGVGVADEKIKIDGDMLTDWGARIMWNVYVWYHYLHTLPTHKNTWSGEHKTQVYICASDDNSIRRIAQSGTTHRILVSYAYFFKGRHLELINQLKNNNNENE